MSGWVLIMVWCAGPDEHSLELVRKDASAHEIAGLRAAQAVRPEATAVPEIVAWGTNWLIIPLMPGTALDPDVGAVPANLFDALARLHARYDGGTDVPDRIPRVNHAWWSGLCRGWVDPQFQEHAARHPADTIARARELVELVADHPTAIAVLDQLTPTLLHGDVHAGNVLVDRERDRAALIDWGSCRVGPAMLDLANLVTADSTGVARYADTWQRLTGQALPNATVELGYRWAGLQIPVQYLPWMIEHVPTHDVEAALDRVEQALNRLAA
ncbi:aminoglycoside phosphotransferase family protein [Micromonospora rifamycinica]|uniref:aminoglycoside phosphotransferase family protein n=1 Tax=Micromonospora rifamycinica TaxID=291594 RepID=UPI0033EF5A42